MITLTKEWLLKTIAELEEERDAVPGVVNEDAAMSLAAMKIALASLEAEPVAYMYKDNLHSDARFSLHTRFGNWSQEDINEYEITEIPLYTVPPAPVSDSLLSELLAIAKKAADEADECAHAEWSDESMEHSAAIADWERRAAMLQGDEHVSNRDELTDGWVACSERLPPEGYETDGGAVCYLVWHKNEVDCGPQYSISNVFFLRKHWEKNFTHWQPLPSPPAK